MSLGISCRLTDCFCHSARGIVSGSGQRKTEDSSCIRNQRIPPQKTQSFKGGKIIQNWFQKRFSGQMMSWNNDSDYEMEQVAAVAAVAYVITLNAESSIQDQEKITESSLIRDKSRREDKAFPISRPSSSSKNFTGCEAWEIESRYLNMLNFYLLLLINKMKSTGEDLRKGSESAENKATVTDVPDEKAIRRAPSFRKPVTFADHIGSSSSAKPDLLSSKSEIVEEKPDLPTIKPERAASKPVLPTIKPERSASKPDYPAIRPVSTAPKPDHPPIKTGTAATRPQQPPPITPVAPGVEAKRQSGARPGTVQTEAEDWEKAEMAKIKDR